MCSWFTCSDEASCHTGDVSQQDTEGANSQLRTEALSSMTFKELNSANNHRTLEVGLSSAESSDETPAWLTPWLQLVRDPEAGKADKLYLDS